MIDWYNCSTYLIELCWNQNQNKNTWKHDWKIWALQSYKQLAGGWAPTFWHDNVCPWGRNHCQSFKECLENEIQPITEKYRLAILFICWGYKIAFSGVVTNLNIDKCVLSVCVTIEFVELNYATLRARLIGFLFLYSSLKVCKLKV